MELNVVKGAVVVSGGCFTFDHSFTVREEENEKIIGSVTKTVFFTQTNPQPTLVWTGIGD